MNWKEARACSDKQFVFNIRSVGKHWWILIRGEREALENHLEYIVHFVGALSR